MAILSDLRRVLRPNYCAKGEAFENLNRFFDNSIWVVRLFYVASLAITYRSIYTTSLRDPGAAYFQWPVYWLEIGDIKQQMVLIPIALFLVNCMLVIWQGSRLLRALFSLLLLFVAAIGNSYGGIGHGWHLMIWISLLLVFLPTTSEDVTRAQKVMTLSVIVYVQTTILLSYSMAGTGKLLYGFQSLFQGHAGGNFSPDGFASLLADRMIIGLGQDIFGDFMVGQPQLGRALFIFTILCQTASLAVAFLPRLHRLWGLILISFHLGTALLMGIYFGTHVLWLAIFLVCSPFAIDRPMLRVFGRKL